MMMSVTAKVSSPVQPGMPALSLSLSPFARHSWSRPKSFFPMGCLPFEPHHISSKCTCSDFCDIFGKVP